MSAPVLTAPPSAATLRKARQETLESAAVADFRHILHRERGRRQAEEFLVTGIRTASEQLAHSTFDMGWWREEGSKFGHWLTDYSLNYLWQNLAADGICLPRQPRRFADNSAGYWAGMQLALLYAQEHYPHSLRPLELTYNQRQKLIWTRRVLRKLVGVGTTHPAKAVLYNGHCTPLRNWPDVCGRVTLGAFFGGDRLPWNTIINSPHLKGGGDKLVLTVLHEETHHGFFRTHRNNYTVRLADYVEENTVRLFEETAALALKNERLPSLDELEQHLHSHKRYQGQEWILWMCEGRGGLSGALQRARRLSLEASRKYREGDVAMLLNAAAGGRRPAYTWRRLLRY